MTFYNDAHEVRPELFDAEALAIAQKIQQVNQTQMRRMFDQIKQLQRRLEAGEEWGKINPLVRLQKAQIAYTIRRGRANNRVKEADWLNLEKFINDGIDSVKTQQDYAVFCDMMEAVYAYHYARAERI